MSTRNAERFIGKLFTIVLVILLSMGVSAWGTTYYIDPNGDDGNNGLSWQTAFATIQRAIDEANDFDIVDVNIGTYAGDGNRDLDFKGKAITLQSTDSNDPNVVAATIIDCNGGEFNYHRGLYFHEGEDANSIVAGLTIINGYTLSGGGIFCDVNSTPTIINCIVKKCRALDSGGGLSGCSGPIINCTTQDNWTAGIGGAFYDCDGEISGCTVIGNVADGNGGGFSLCDGHITECTIIGNEAGYDGNGGGLSNCNATINGCTISENTANYDSGGGLDNCGGDISNCTIADNEAGMDGGGLNNCDGRLDGCTISGNSALWGGGLFGCDGTIANCIIKDNSAQLCTGGLYWCDGSIINCIITGNSARFCCGGLSWCGGSIINCTIVGNSIKSTEGACAGALTHCTGTVNSCILWDNTLPVFIDSSPEFCCIQYWAGGNGNIATDPCFADPGYWDANGTPDDANDDFWVDGNDYHLQSAAGRWDPNSKSWVTDADTSLCIDAGDPNLNVGSELWPHGLRINIGAYGGTPQASKSSSEAGRFFDLNHNGSVNFEDFAILANKWLMEEVPLAEDLNKDGIVDFNDLEILTDYWLYGVQLPAPELYEDFETGDFNQNPWEHDPNGYAWTVVSDVNYEGNYAAKSASIGNNQQSILQITLGLEHSNHISFYRKVSSEEDYDWLCFYIDGIKQTQWSGEQDWALETYIIDPNQHTFKWAYEKDYSASGGSDCAWLDYILVYFEPEE